MYTNCKQALKVELHICSYVLYKFCHCLLENCECMKLTNSYLKYKQLSDARQLY